jgi:hypothetical protein
MESDSGYWISALEADYLAMWTLDGFRVGDHQGVGPFPIPEDRPRWGKFDELSEANLERLNVGCANVHGVGVERL